MKLGTLTAASLLFIGMTAPAFAAQGTLLAQTTPAAPAKTAPAGDLGATPAATGTGAQDTQPAPKKKKTHKAKTTKTHAPKPATGAPAATTPAPAPVQH
jgi:hypothetical protein